MTKLKQELKAAAPSIETLSDHIVEMTYDAESQLAGEDSIGHDITMGNIRADALQMWAIYQRLLKVRESKA